MPTDKIFTLFSQGTYGEVLAHTLDVGQMQPAQVPWIVGSLIFLGRTAEGENLYASAKPKLSAEARAACLFFMGIGWTRRAKYAKAKSLFRENHDYIKAHPDCSAEIRFYRHQGVAFYLFYLGEFPRSLKAALKAQQTSMEAGNLWMRTLASDLVANNMIFAGHIHEGLEVFEITQQLARKIDNKPLQEATEISKLIYACEYGINIQENLHKLQVKYAEYRKKDNFSRNNVALELARQYTLRGEFDTAEKLLEEITNSIFSAENRRQEVRLNLLWAELCYLRNELAIAQHYLRSANRCLNFVDQTYEIQILGLELKVHESLFQTVDETKKSRLLSLSQHFSTSKNKNILSRQDLATSGEKEQDQDKIHQWLKKIAEHPQKSRHLVIETGYFSWLLKFFKIPRGQSLILLGLEEKSITLISKKGIHHAPEALTGQNYKILKALDGQVSSKEDLVKKIWGYEYDPLRHDSLIYSALSALRKHFSQHAEFIQNSDEGYSLTVPILEMAKNLFPSNAVTPVSPEPQTLREMSSLSPLNQEWLVQDLNHRQIQILEFLQTERFISVKICRELFKVSEITASRDLSGLRAKKLVQQLGSGRATRYTNSSALQKIDSKI